MVSPVVAVVLLLAAAVALFAAWRAGAGKWSSAGGVVIDERGRVALVRQRDRKGRWRWTLPKGRIDRGESPEQAALRELHEESGLRGRIIEPIAIHEGRLNFIHYFEMAIEGDDGVHDHETKEVRLVPVTEAAE